MGIFNLIWDSGFLTDDGQMAGSQVAFSLILSLCITLAIEITLYILKAVGVYTLCKKAGITRAWLSFVPFAVDYKLGQLAAPCSFGTFKIKGAPLFYMLSHIALFSCELTVGILRIILVSNGVAMDSVVIPLAYQSIYATQEVLGYISTLFNLAYIFIFVIVIFAFFRKYSAKNAMIFSIASIFLNIEGILIFAVRKNRPVDYAAYVRARQEQYYRQNQMYYQQRENNYSRPEDPFSEFNEAKKPDEPKTPSEYPDNDEFFN